jgi:hypothetical protein
MSCIESGDGHQDMVMRAHDHTFSDPFHVWRACELIERTMLCASVCLIQILDVLWAEEAERCGAVQTFHIRDMAKFPEPRRI